MDTFSHVARSLGIEWAEQTFTRLGLRRYPIPGRWPGTGLEARKLVADATAEPLNPLDRELLAYEVLRVAQETWRELVSPE